MKKVTKMVLMLCFVLSGALCYAHGVARTEVKGDGTPSIVIIKAQCGGTDKSNSIIPSINGNVLSVLFSENLGQVTVEITTVAGATVDYASTITPNGIQFYVPNTGSYIINFTLPNGDEYYGEFTVTD